MFKVYVNDKEVESKQFGTFDDAVRYAWSISGVYIRSQNSPMEYKRGTIEIKEITSEKSENEKA